MSAREGTPEVASSTALVPDGYGYLDTPLGPDISQYNPPTASASGNAVPVNMSHTNVLNQHLHVHQAQSTDTRLMRLSPKKDIGMPWISRVNNSIS